MVWVSSTEPVPMKALGVSTQLPERYGVDVLWRAQGGFCGIQRKELSDLLASVQDGRLGKEIHQMGSLEVRWLVVEGAPKWTRDGLMVGLYGKPWSKGQFDHLLRSCATSGLIVERSVTIDGTVALCRDIVEWSRGTHTSLHKRPGPVSVWGKAGNRDYQVHLIQGLPDIGPELANRILNDLGMPFGWKVSKAELMSVHGVGLKRANRIWAALETVTP